MTTAGSVSKGGDIIWDDLDHDGVIGDSDRRILGNGMPTWYMGWTNYLNYKNFHYPSRSMEVWQQDL